MEFYRRWRKWFILPLVLAGVGAELLAAASSRGQEIEAVSPVEYGSFVDNQGIPIEGRLNPTYRQRRSQPFQKQNDLPDVPQLPQSPRRNPIPSRRSIAIADIQVRFVDEDGQPTPGNTRPYIITREFDLQPGDVYRPEVAQQGLERVTELDIVEDATLSLQQTNQPNQIVMILTLSLLEVGRFYGNFVPYIQIFGFPGTQRLPLGALCYLLTPCRFRVGRFQTGLAVWVSHSPWVPI